MAVSPPNTKKGHGTIVLTSVGSTRTLDAQWGGVVWPSVYVEGSTVSVTLADTTSGGTPPSAVALLVLVEDAVDPAGNYVTATGGSVLSTGVLAILNLGSNPTGGTYTIGNGLDGSGASDSRNAALSKFGTFRLVVVTGNTLNAALRVADGGGTGAFHHDSDVNDASGTGNTVTASGQVTGVGGVKCKLTAQSRTAGNWAYGQTITESLTFKSAIDGTSAPYTNAALKNIKVGWSKIAAPVTATDMVKRQDIALSSTGVASVPATNIDSDWGQTANGDSFYSEVAVGQNFGDATTPAGEKAAIYAIGTTDAADNEKMAYVFANVTQVSPFVNGTDTNRRLRTNTADQLASAQIVISSVAAYQETGRTTLKTRFKRKSAGAGSTNDNLGKNQAHPFMQATVKDAYGTLLASKSTKTHIAKATSVEGTATGGSATTLIDTGKNFVTLGFAANDKLYVKAGAGAAQILTVTSITTTTNANDTLNFASATASASGSTYTVAHADLDSQTISTDANGLLKWEMDIGVSEAAGNRFKKTSPDAVVIYSDTASGGTTTTLLDTGVNFVTLGVQVGDVLKFQSGAGEPHRVIITAVASTQLTFAKIGTAPNATTTYTIETPVYTQRDVFAIGNAFSGTKEPTSNVSFSAFGVNSEIVLADMFTTTTAFNGIDAESVPSGIVKVNQPLGSGSLRGKVSTWVNRNIGQVHGRDNSIATSGSTTTLVNTAKNFGTIGVRPGHIIHITNGTGNGQSMSVTDVTTTTNPNDTLTFAAVSTGLNSTSVYEVADFNPRDGAGNPIDIAGSEIFPGSKASYNLSLGAINDAVANVNSAHQLEQTVLGYAKDAGGDKGFEIFATPTDPGQIAFYIAYADSTTQRGTFSLNASDPETAGFTSDSGNYGFVRFVVTYSTFNEDLIVQATVSNLAAPPGEQIRIEANLSLILSTRKTVSVPTNSDGLRVYIGQDQGAGLPMIDIVDDGGMTDTSGGALTDFEYIFTPPTNATYSILVSGLDPNGARPAPGRAILKVGVQDTTILPAVEGGDPTDPGNHWHKGKALLVGAVLSLNGQELALDAAGIKIAILRFNPAIGSLEYLDPTDAALNTWGSVAANGQSWATKFFTTTSTPAVTQSAGDNKLWLLQLTSAQTGGSNWNDNDIFADCVFTYLGVTYRARTRIDTLGGKFNHKAHANLQSVRTVTTAALPAHSVDSTGNVLTASANGALGSQDGVTPAVGDYLLVKNEGTASHNGTYSVTQVGDGTHPWILTRLQGFNTYGVVFSGYRIAVGHEGTTQADTMWALATSDPITVAVTALTFQRVGRVFPIPESDVTFDGTAGHQHTGGTDGRAIGDRS